MPKAARTYRRKLVKADERRLENTNPELAAAIIERWGDNPYEGMLELARHVGVPPATAQALIERLKTRYSPAVAEMRQHTTRDFQKLLDERMMMALEYLGDVTMAGASAKDLAIVFGILAEKRALLRGEPTSIVRHEDRMALAELLPAVLHEAARRGMTIDLTPSDYTEAEGTSARVILDQPRQQARMASKQIVKS